MNIGNGWSKTTESSKCFISVSFDKAFLELHPEFKNCFFNLWYVSPDDRKGENSPDWNVILSAKNEKNDEKK